ncbi:hypothetical protein CEQ90_06130 [Lewinellaceae bacterium SD302]|nr:hypothetical protein CEQ90_06130 [Lewinellaceae bacterium SD302]
MSRLLLLILLFLPGLTLYADALDKRIALLLPDEAESRQTERQYVKGKLNNLIIQLKADRLDRKNTKKKIKGITERVTALFLKRYSKKAGLEEFFRKGQYNDVTLALVYALLMEEFEVPWFAMVDHWSVSLLADPSGKKQQLAGAGRKHDRAIERGYRAEYVQMLNLTVLPAQRPTTTEGIDSLYYVYHYRAKELLDFNQLAAYWHYERALSAYYYRDYLLTVRRLSLAKQLEERLAFSALEQATYIQLANLEGDDGQQSLFYLFELWNKDPDNRYIPSALLTTFIHETDVLIKSDNDFLAGEQLYNFLDSRGQNQPAWRRELKELYYLQKTRHSAVRGRYDEVRTYVDSLYHMEPDNPVFRQLAGDLSLWTLRSSGASGVELKEQLDVITTRYPFVKGYKGMNNLVLADLAKEIRGHYEADQGYEGDNLLLQFRNSLASTTPGRRRATWVLTAYLAASNYYFRMRDYRQALNLIKEGLRYSPEDDYLLHRKEVLEKY